jgi:hypothetical protein
MPEINLPVIRRQTVKATPASRAECHDQERFIGL